MRKFILGLLLLGLFAGCNTAGLAHDLLAYDNIIKAAVEARKGVDAFNATVVVDTAHRQAAMIQAVSKGIVDLAQDSAIDEEAAKALAQAVTEKLITDLANYTEQERRRAHLYEVTIDNLNYIIEVSEKGKKFSIYRADVNQQWKDYLESTARSAIGTID